MNSEECRQMLFARMSVQEQCVKHTHISQNNYFIIRNNCCFFVQSLNFKWRKKQTKLEINILCNLISSSESVLIIYWHYYFIKIKINIEKLEQKKAIKIKKVSSANLALKDAEKCDKKNSFLSFNFILILKLKK